MTTTLSAPGVSSSHPTAEVLIRAADLDDRATWLIARQSGVTATDSRVLNGCPYANENVYDKYQSKIQTIDPTIEEEQVQIEWELGSDLEPVITKFASRHFGVTMTKVGMLRHVEHKHLLSSPDRNTSDGGHCELKATATHYLRRYQDETSEWTNEDRWTLPPAWRIQALHQLMVSGRSHVHVAAMITDRRRFTYWTVERDATEEAIIRILADKFWFDHVVPQIPPPIEWDTVTVDEMKKRFPEAVVPRTVVDDPATVVGLIARRELLKGQIKDAGGKLDEVENLLRSVAGDAVEVWAPGEQKKPLFKYGNGVSTTYDAKQMAADHGIDLAKYTRRTPFRSFRSVMKVGA